jgi:hypothetical protein
LLVLVLLLPACGGNGTPPAPPPVETGEALKELADVYKYLTSQKLPPPRKIDDLSEYSGSLEGAMPLIQAGAVVVIWGAGYSPSSTEVLAYEKDAPSAGGKVLLRNGTVKQMTADEFKAAKR